MTKELLTGADLKGPLQLNGAAGTSGQVLTSAGTGAIPTWSAAGGFSGGTLTSNLTVAAGTTSLSPLTFQSGTNLTTAAAGAMEYDGKVIYSTPAGRGVSPSMMVYRLNSDLAGAAVTTAQSVLGAGVTLAASTIYSFSGLYAFTKSLGVTSHTFGIGFGGTATLNNVLYQGTTNGSNNANFYGNIAGALSFLQNSATSFSLQTIANSTRTQMVFFFGTVSVNASGTFIPQYTLSALPGGGGLYTTIAGSYFTIWPIGASGANTSVGPWA